MDGAKWGITDFYPEMEKKLRSALRSAGPFDISWSVKKEIQAGRIRRTARDMDHLHVSVWTAMDDGPDLVDTLLWDADGERESCGWAVAVRLAPTLSVADAFAEKFCSTMRRILSAQGLIFEENEAQAYCKVPFAEFRKLEDLVPVLNSLMDSATSDLDSTYDRALSIVRKFITPEAARTLVPEV